MHLPRARSQMISNEVFIAEKICDNPHNHMSGKFNQRLITHSLR